MMNGCVRWIECQDATELYIFLLLSSRRICHLAMEPSRATLFGIHLCSECGKTCLRVGVRRAQPGIHGSWCDPFR